jgi:hypothetical protein
VFDLGFGVSSCGLGFLVLSLQDCDFALVATVELFGQLVAFLGNSLASDGDLFVASGALCCEPLFVATVLGVEFGDLGEAVAILNPDLHFLPGALAALMDYVFDHPECGCVDPATCIDALGVFNLPRNLLPTPAEHMRVTLAQLSPLMCRRYSAYRTRRALEWWASDQPIESDMLSGCCLFMRREVIEKMGRVMDPRYPLYFEDTDLFRTLREMGLTVVHHSGARILHHWSRSARVGGDFDNEPQRRHDISRREYYAKFYGAFGNFLVSATNRLFDLWPKKKIGRPMAPMPHLGEFNDPIEIQLPRSCRFLIEIAVHPTFIICGGIFGEGDRWTCPPEAWEWLFKLEYYIRAVDLDTLEPLGYWRFTKVPVGREVAMTSDELDALGDRLLSAAAS